jgi:hypothetical protein
MAQNSDTSDDGSGTEPEFDERVSGLLEQVKADYASGTETDARALLVQRLEQTGIDLPSADVDSLVREIEDTRR